MQVKDIMTTQVVCVDPEMKISKIAEILFKNRYHGMPVVERGKLVGIVTENDFFSQKDNILFLPEYVGFLKEANVADEIPSLQKDKIERIINIKARDIMTTDCVTISPETEISQLLNVIRETKFNTIPVTNAENRILGIVTLVDIVGLFDMEGNKNIIKARSNGRAVDDLIENVDSWWGRSFVLIKKSRFLAWKKTLAISFVSGIIIILFWIISF